jgi:hypothetical protein
LPKELVIEFGIAQKELIISAYLLKAVPPPPKKSEGPSATIGQPKTTLYLFFLSSLVFFLFCSLFFSHESAYKHSSYVLLLVRDSLFDSFLRHENQHFQIAEQTQIECPIKKLDTIFELIQGAYEHCIDFEEKIVALSSTNTFFL